MSDIFLDFAWRVGKPCGTSVGIVVVAVNFKLGTSETQVTCGTA
jgi:hypothetical protein